MLASSRMSSNCPASTEDFFVDFLVGVVVVVAAVELEGRDEVEPKYAADAEDDARGAGDKAANSVLVPVRLSMTRVGWTSGEEETGDALIQILLLSDVSEFLSQRAQSITLVFYRDTTRITSKLHSL